MNRGRNDKEDDLEIKVFTNRPDTLFGVICCYRTRHPLDDTITKPEFKSVLLMMLTVSRQKN